MKALRQLFAVSVLVLMLALYSSAGIIHTTDEPPPPNQTTAVGGEMSTSDNGDMHTTNSDEATAGDTVVAGALGLLQGVWSLL